MFPTILELGPITIHTYGTMIAVGFLTAVFFIQRDARKAGFDPKVFGDMAFVVLPLGIAGTRLAHIIMFPQHYSWSDPVGWVAVWRGGLVFQGAIPPVLAYIVWNLRRKNIPFMQAMDIIFPYVGLGHGIGRMGCFFKGCCYGRPTDVAWGIAYPRIVDDATGRIVGAPAFMDHMRRFSDVTVHSDHAHAVHPTQLYSVAGLLTIFVVILILRNRWHPFPGFTMPLYFLFYGVFRFIVEFYRGDHNPVRMFNLSDQQVFSLAFALLGLVLFAILYRRNARNTSNSEGASA